VTPVPPTPRLPRRTRALHGGYSEVSFVILVSGFVIRPEKPLTPTLSPEYRGEGETDPHARISVTTRPNTSVKR